MKHMIVTRKFSQKMNSIPLFAILLLTAAYVVSPADAVVKRATDLLKDMMANATQSTTDYSGYGCFCFGGKGKPVDDVDRCCKEHVDCYTSVINKYKPCSPSTKYYKYSCQSEKCFCDPVGSRCGYNTCVCDQILSQCVASKKYNAAYKNYDRKKC
ncbi:basic phospholipase A2-like [Physella acuta]|uniref:basic phospholipase A2-like n=1 Tax=Physella acuta TaxID=109671 RepID=UPI0027DC2749|nr:basic phospholipase A2-like [Physella acuta]XP_059171240.1 basic phospholipase A2-like [Physella acuta]